MTCGHSAWRYGRCWVCVRSSRTVTWPMNRSLTTLGSFSETRADRCVCLLSLINPQKKNISIVSITLSLFLLFRCTCLVRPCAHRVYMSWCLAAGAETVNYGLPLRTFTPSSPKTPWTWFRKWQRDEKRKNVRKYVWTTVWWCVFKQTWLSTLM